MDDFKAPYHDFSRRNLTHITLHIYEVFCERSWAPGLFLECFKLVSQHVCSFLFKGDTVTHEQKQKQDLVIHPLDWGRMLIFKAAGAMLPCCTTQSRREVDPLQPFWLELGVRDMESFSNLYTHKRDKPPKIAHSPQRESYSPQKTWRRRHGWICCNDDSCFLVWHMSIWRLESWHLSNVLGPYEQIHFSDGWAMVWKHLAKAWGLPQSN